MNQLRSLTCIVVRSYSKQIRKKPDIAGVRGKITLTKETAEDELYQELESQDADDISALEADFTNVHESHISHEMQIKRDRVKLQQAITAKKYFKKVDPPFLTLVEREKIKRLHNQDPEEWSIQRLSEKFPALPETIKKILKDKWRPKTVERVLEHDRKIVDNWKKFTSGKLAVNPALRDHLLKFGDKGSKIDLKHTEKVAASLVAPEIEIPKPKHNIFSRLVEPSDEKPEEKLLPAQEEEEQVHKEIETEALKEAKGKQRKSKENKAENLTFHEFAEKKYPEVYEKSPVEATALLEAYVRQSEIVPKDKTKKSSVQVLNETKELVPIEEEQKEHTALQTYVVKKETIEDMPPVYVLPIKIPKGAYEKGKTYRIYDCYYDDDGEFLYRTPGLTGKNEL